VDVFWRVVRTAPTAQDPLAIRAGVAALGRPFDIAEAQLQSHRYLAGDAFTLADIQFGR